MTQPKRHCVTIFQTYYSWRVVLWQIHLYLLPPYLVSECQTRWVISRTTEQQKSLTQVLSYNKTMLHLNPTWQDTDILKSVRKALGQQLDCSTELSEEQNVGKAYLKLVLPHFDTLMPLMQARYTWWRPSGRCWVQSTRNIKLNLLWRRWHLVCVRKLQAPGQHIPREDI